MAGADVKNPVFETMTKYHDGNLYIRVWREEPRFKLGPDKEVISAILLGDKGCIVNQGDFIKAIIEDVCKLPRISAIEVIGPTGNGVVHYPDWK